MEENMICENCNIEHDGSYGSGRFCSSKCARGFATKKDRRQISDKVRASLTKPKEISICPECEKEFAKVRNRTYCSNACASKARWKNQEYKAKVKETINDLAKEGKFGGWKVRTAEPSYAEKYFIEVLNNAGIPFTREKYESGFFIDFALDEIKIALEIDGQQHFTDENRIESDKKKDEVLSKNGWKVIRIKWESPNSQKGREHLKLHIQSFLEQYNLQRVDCW